MSKENKQETQTQDTGQDNSPAGFFTEPAKDILITPLDSLIESTKQGRKTRDEKYGKVKLDDSFASFGNKLEVAFTKAPVNALRVAANKAEMRNHDVDKTLKKVREETIGDAWTLPVTVPIGLGLGSIGGYIIGKLVNKYIRKKPEKSAVPYALLGAGLGGTISYLSNAPVARRGGEVLDKAQKKLSDIFFKSFSDDPEMQAAAEARRRSMAKTREELQKRQEQARIRAEERARAMRRTRSAQNALKVELNK